MGWREYWDTSPSHTDFGVLTIERLLDLKDLDLDVRDDEYLRLGVTMNHATNAPEHLNKAAQKMRGTPARRTTGLLATPPSAPPLDLSDF